ncbi:MAG: hypothetical protein A2091_01830 [Desulfuromonadales bacterium GWD2_61_12]|nr:MAG: hypothetical protein A2005_06015 [Desulfuromonadales bacterium GWC2_61_20]OGR35721.1 MAG: hypothetical protein A2091_01830 [Desulfuromonadales bacterium GWD2_61_12]HAD04410.1 hypothetical protein [Desulfuromonas sp.]HBT82952.1 hypothetical protein [Desulfuromonas sp.]
MKNFHPVNYFRDLLAVALLGLFLPASAAAEAPLRYAGATTLQRDFMPEATTVFSKTANITFSISGGNSDAGIQTLQAGMVDIAGAGRFLNAAEKAAGLKEYQIGWDPLVFVIHRSNPISSLSQDQLRGIFSGAIVSWKELGGRDQPVVVVLGPAGSGLYAAVQQLILHGRKPTTTALITPLVTDGDQQVAQLPTAICALSMSMIDHPAVKRVRVDGIEPSLAEVTAHRYPLLRPLTLVTGPSPRPVALRFIDFARSPEGQKLMAKKFFPLAVH